MFSHLPTTLYIDSQNLDHLSSLTLVLTHIALPNLAPAHRLRCTHMFQAITANTLYLPISHLNNLQVQKSKLVFKQGLH